MYFNMCSTDKLRSFQLHKCTLSTEMEFFNYEHFVFLFSITVLCFITSSRSHTSCCCFHGSSDFQLLYYHSLPYCLSESLEGHCLRPPGYANFEKLSKVLILQFCPLLGGSYQGSWGHWDLKYTDSGDSIYLCSAL